MSLAELIQDREFWLEFISEYQNLPVLWKANHPHFSSKKCRDQALTSLTKKVRTRWPGANVEFIKQRISNFRRTFLNEYEKVRQSKESNNVYVPNLYYYNHIKFLKEQDNETLENIEQPKSSSLPKPSAAQKVVFCEDFVREKDKRLQIFSRNSCKLETTYDEPNSPKRIKLLPITNDDIVTNIVLENENYDIPTAAEDSSKLTDKLENDFSIVEVISDPPSTPPLTSQACEQKESEHVSHEHVLHTTKEEFDDIARRVATHFSKMDPEQCLFAEKLIFDICISGRLKRLSARTNISDY